MQAIDTPEFCHGRTGSFFDFIVRAGTESLRDYLAVYPGHRIVSEKNRKLLQAWSHQDPPDA